MSGPVVVGIPSEALNVSRPTSSIFARQARRSRSCCLGLSIHECICYCLLLGIVGMVTMYTQELKALKREAWSEKWSEAWRASRFYYHPPPSSSPQPPTPLLTQLELPFRLELGLPPMPTFSPTTVRVVCKSHKPPRPTYATLAHISPLLRIPYAFLRQAKIAVANLIVNKSCKPLVRKYPTTKLVN
jgi:hypothetical protein